MRQLRVALSAIPLALALTIVLAPAASAQVPSLPQPDDAVADVGAAAGEVLGGATGTVDETVSGTTGTVEDNVSRTTDTVENTVKDTISKTTEPLPDEVKEAVNSATGTVTEPLNPVLNKVGGNLPGTTDPISGNLTDPTRAGNDDSRRDGSTRNHDRDKAQVRGTRAAATADRQVDVGGIAVAISSGDRIHRSTATAGPSLLQQAAEAAVQGLVRVAFPLLLAVMVAAFLAFQGRVGRNDPKLLLAPLDPEQATLTFR